MKDTNYSFTMIQDTKSPAWSQNIVLFRFPKYDILVPLSLDTTQYLIGNILSHREFKKEITAHLLTLVMNVRSIID